MPGANSAPRMAVVHDWLDRLGDAERVLAAILRCYPGADVFCLFDVLEEHERRLLGFERSTTSFLQHMPLIRSHSSLYLPLMPLAVEQIDLRPYNLVLSSSSAVAKGVLTGPDQLHITYLHSPPRYGGEFQHGYFHENGMHNGMRGALARVLLHRMRLWDQRTSNGVDAYIANSRIGARRVRKYYGRNAVVIHPPIDVEHTYSPRQRERFFLTASRLTRSTNVRSIVEAFGDLPEEQLIAVGDGPQASMLARIAGPNVLFAGYLDKPRLHELMGAARAFISAEEADFGSMPLEAQAQGTPVLALGKGGVREMIIADGPGPTGLLFAAAEPAAITATIRRFIDREHQFVSERCYQNAVRFRHERFAQEFTDFVETQWRHFRSSIDDAQAPLLGS